MLFTSVAVGQSNYFGFCFTTLNWKPLYFEMFFFYFASVHPLCKQNYVVILRKLPWLNNFFLFVYLPTHPSTHAPTYIPTHPLTRPHTQEQRGTLRAAGTFIHITTTLIAHQQSCFTTHYSVKLFPHNFLMLFNNSNFHLKFILYFNSSHSYFSMLITTEVNFAFRLRCLKYW